MKLNHLFLAFGLVTLVGCGGDSNDADTTYDTGTAYYIDSAVSGINYTCGEEQGVTTDNGEFTFEVDKDCTFYLDTTTLRGIDVEDLENGAAIQETNINLLRILQSLDSDGDPDNGIAVTTNSDLATAIITFLSENSISSISDLDDETMSTLESALTESGITLVTENAAYEHLLSTILASQIVYMTDEESDMITEWDLTASSAISVEGTALTITSADQESTTSNEESTTSDEESTASDEGSTTYFLTDVTSDYFLIGGMHVFYSYDDALTYLDTLPDSILSFTDDIVDGRTFYQVWYDSNPVIVSTTFNSDGTVTRNGLLNSTVADTPNYTLTEDGLLYARGADEEILEGNRIACGSTADYFKTSNFKVDSDNIETYNNTDLYFFDLDVATTYTDSLTGTIERSSCDLTTSTD